MRKRFFFRKNKKGFTLMECVCAIAIVGLLTAVMLPLISGALVSMNASKSLRDAASIASAQNATTATVTSGSGKNVVTMYVNVTIGDLDSEGAFVFTKSNESIDVSDKFTVQVTYYDLKNGNETLNASK